MLDNKGFDLWADGYDKTVGISDEENSYPFAGYKEILGMIYKKVLEREKPTILDIGFGTGTLTTKLYEKGCEIYGQDFSERMIELAQKKMPNAHLYQGDFSKGLVKPLLQHTYDFIIATYSLHHLSDDAKIQFIQLLKKLLKENGSIFIGDVAFQTRADLEKCQREVMDEWDEDEIYFVIDELKKAFPKMEFTQVSYCAGVLVIKR
ncbi:class I SAM-dependent methyltransferase [Roseburia sp. MSJ-14]|uniref:class I SAM-dependent methyltransferase n=1 Tax=Roseburia sp. MSJ-14 TaxID=2841514 RepID=UPI001C10A68B|nr:class I SAM-dependent methyltransferase [Roseburia sp. MSJ-14]MBU5472143.1 class I SAM-dependent methyltransferase [Roseburia sp. MSJ-14]